MAGLLRAGADAANLAAAAPWLAAAAVALGLWVPLRLARRARRRGQALAAAGRLEQRAVEAAAEVEARRRAETRAAGEAFLAELSAALESGRSVPEAELPTAWLDEMRPVLAEAYGLLAENALAGAVTAADLIAARRWAGGAAAAGAAGGETMLLTIDEALLGRVFDRFGEAQLLAWRVARVAPVLAARRLGQGLPRESLYRTGAALRLAGWEPEDLRDAALAALSADPGAAWRAEGAPQPTRDDAGPADAGIEEGVLSRVVALARRAPVPAATPAEGLRRLRLAQVGREAASGPRALRVRANAAWEAGRAGRNAEAERVFAETAERMEANPDFGPDHRDTLTLRHNAIRQAAAQGRLEAAERQMRELLARMERGAGLPATDRLVLAARVGLAELVERRGGRAEALVLYRSAVAAWEEAAAAGARCPEALWARARMLAAATPAVRALPRPDRPARREGSGAEVPADAGTEARLA